MTMPSYIDIEPLIKEGWQLQKYNHGEGFTNVEHALLQDIPPADVRPMVSEVEKAFCTKLANLLTYCAFETSGCGLCPHSDEGCSATRIKLTAADRIRKLL